MSDEFSQYYKEADADASISGRNDIKGRPFWTPPTHKTNWVNTRIRIMPPPANKSDDKFYTWVPLHNGLPGAQQPVLCPAKHADLYCPACAAANEFKQSGNEQMRLKFIPTWRALVNVVVLDLKGNVTPDSRPLWWGMPKRTNDDLQQKIEELISNGQNGNITSPKHGRDVYVRRMGENDRTRYEISPALEPNPMSPDIMAMMPKLNSLEIEECYDLLPAAKISALLSPQSGGRDGGWSTPPETVEGVFTAIPEKSSNPFGDEPEPEPDDDEPAVDANPFAEDKPPFDVDDDDDDDDAPAPTPVANPQAKINAARDRLMSKVAKPS